MKQRHQPPSWTRTLRTNPVQRSYTSRRLHPIVGTLEKASLLNTTTTTKKTTTTTTITSSSKPDPLSAAPQTSLSTTTTTSLCAQREEDPFQATQYFGSLSRRENFPHLPDWVRAPECVVMIQRRGELNWDFVSPNTSGENEHAAFPNQQVSKIVQEKVQLSYSYQPFGDCYYDLLAACNNSDYSESFPNNGHEEPNSFRFELSRDVDVFFGDLDAYDESHQTSSECRGDWGLLDLPHLPATFAAPEEVSRDCSKFWGSNEGEEATPAYPLSSNNTGGYPSWRASDVSS